MEETMQPVPEQKKPDANKIATIIAALLLLTAVAGGVYFWQNQKVQTLTARNAELHHTIEAITADDKQAANKNQTEAESTQTATGTEAGGTSKSSDEQVLAAVKAWCGANVDPDTKKPLVLAVGKAGAEQKPVLYSADKKFAYVNAVCSADGTTEYSGMAYYLKNVDGVWVYLYRGQMASDQEAARYGIPEEFN